MKKISKMAGATTLCAGMMLSSAVCASGGDENNAFAVGAYKAKVMESIGHGKRVYFAGPMFNQAEKDFNLAMTKILEEHGYQVFLPQRDGIEAVKLEGKTEEEVVRMIFELDVREVRNADIVF
ncbi:MAG: nucleoside 2-deoxyribosyltransferase domain-containing protein, partial [Selenomonadaceae bacterium]|nr:nucleoside 2-deoxyribosyltransferase domain-containing protein [Selenomonadaceae bacterium]